MKNLKTFAGQFHNIRERIKHISIAQTWFLLVCFFVLVNILSLIISARTFLKISTGVPSDAIARKPLVQSVDRNHLKDVLSQFAARSLESENKKNNPISLSDPSR